MRQSLIIITLVSMMLTACAQQRGGRGDRPAPFAPNPSVILANDIAQNRAAQEEKNAYAALYNSAAERAIIFTPEPTEAKSWLKQRQPLAGSSWQPHSVFMSCDGRTGVTTGAIKWGKLNGFYSTVWRYFPAKNNKGEWRWILTHTGGLDTAREAPEFLSTKTASCKGTPTAPIIAPPVGVQMKKGYSRDQSLSWTWQYRPDGSRSLTVDYWDGTTWQRGIKDHVKTESPAAQ